MPESIQNTLSRILPLFLHLLDAALHDSEKVLSCCPDRGIGGMPPPGQGIHHDLSLGGLVEPDIMPALASVMVGVKESVGGPVAVVHACDHARDLGLVNARLAFSIELAQEVDTSATS
jgi:hypothetical protein